MENPIARERQITATVDDWLNINGMKNSPVINWQIQMMCTRDVRMLPVRFINRSEIQPAVGIKITARAQGKLLNQPMVVSFIW